MLQARVELERGFGDERERALGADDELGEVVAGRRLHELAAGPDDLARREHRFEPEHLVAGHAVLHCAHAAGVRSRRCRRGSRCTRRGTRGRSGRAPPRPRRAGPRSRRARRPRRGSRCRSRRPGSCARTRRRCASGFGTHAPGEPGAGAARRDRDTGVVGDPEHLATCAVSAGPDHEGGPPAGDGERLVVRVVLADGVASEDVRRLEHLGQPFCDVRCHAHRFAPPEVTSEPRTTAAQPRWRRGFRA